MRDNLRIILLATLILVVIAPSAHASGAYTLPEEVVLPITQMLVNKNNPLPADYLPENLININSFVNSSGNVKMHPEAAQALQEMLAALKTAGFTDIYANSGYRDFKLQGELYAAKVTSYRQQGWSETAARTQAARWVAPPGESEHQTGLAVDLSTASLGYALVEAFAQTAAGRWLAEHCAKYGFIVRYRAEKEPLTGIASEPWHFRYVGIDHAFYMQQLDLCLEEYHAQLREKSPLLFENAQGEKRAIYYRTGDTGAGLPGKLLTISRARYSGAERISTLIPLPPEQLFDARGHWAEPYILRLRDLGIVKGYADQSFRPDAGVSRGEFITALSRLPLAIFADKQISAAGLAASDQEFSQYPFILPYADVDAKKYYYQPLLICYRASLVQVLENKGALPPLFEADRPLLRGEAALLLAQTINTQNFILPIALSYRDVPPAAGQMYHAVELLRARGIIAGDSDGLFHPERGVSRAEMCAMLCRLLDTI